MIDFRYHLVSMIAVFLALAVGLIVGVTALSGPAESALHAELNKVSTNNATLAKGEQNYRNQANAAQTWAQANAQLLLKNLLPGKNVVLVLAPNADGTVTNGVTAALQQAGATVTGQVTLGSQFMDTSVSTEDSLFSLAQRWAPTAGVSLPSQSPNPAVRGQQAAAAVIAATILSKNGDGLAAASSDAVLSAFHSFVGLSNIPGTASTPASATMAVLVAPGSTTTPGSDGADQVLVAVAQQLNLAGEATVMAANISANGSGSAISAENGAGNVSTVDNADTESGQVMVVQALVLAADGGQSAKAYGVEPDAAPSPAPTPSSSPSTTAPTTTTGKAGAKKK